MLSENSYHDHTLINKAKKLVVSLTGDRLYQHLISILDRHNEIRGKQGINLVAADSPMSRQARYLLSCELGTRASCGEIGRRSRYFTGLDQADEIEALAISLINDLFQCKHSDPRLMGGVHANTVVYSMLKKRFNITNMFALNPFYGGNLSNYKMGPPGILDYSIIDLPIEPQTLKIDLNKFEYLANVHKPLLVSLGAGVHLFPFPVREIKDIISQWGGRVFFDGAHQAGLIAAGVYPNPILEGADVFTGSTGKTFSGPQGGIICWNDDHLSRPIETMIFPTLTGSHQLNRVASLVVTCIEMRTFGKKYMRTGINNAKRLASLLHSEGLEVLGAPDYTETHQIIVKWCYPEGAKAATYRLENVGIFVNAVALPGDGHRLSGIRIGVTEVTRLGITHNALVVLAKVIAGCLLTRCFDDHARIVVADLAKELQTFKYCLDDT
ncbi:beta-eliminating lyase-related protein [Vibrio lamellibrachiae]|uniref:serine hydroxymethyltransferase n=1 Tax=Vibrio lamellibrachiae TaxID=2910253 RepID=UPI003D0E6C7A